MNERTNEWEKSVCDERMQNTNESPVEYDEVAEMGRRRIEYFRRQKTEGKRKVEETHMVGHRKMSGLACGSGLR
jgi:hypothetical protein